MSQIAGVLCIAFSIYYFIYAYRKYKKKLWRWSGLQFQYGVIASICSLALGLLLILEKLSLAELFDF